MGKDGEGGKDVKKSGYMGWMHKGAASPAGKTKKAKSPKKMKRA